jgi:hypothetical protein
MDNSAGVGRNRWLRIAGSAITAAVLLAVPALGLTQFTPGLLTSGAGEANWLDGLFALDGPTSTMEKPRHSSVQNKEKAKEEVLVLSDWNFTNGPHTSPQR